MTGQPSAIFFDMDGTILDWQTGMDASWIAACEEHGDGSHTPMQLLDAIKARRTWFWDDQQRAKRGRMDLDGASREIVRRAFEDLSIDTADRGDRADRLADSYRARRLADIVPYPGAIATLDAIRERGIPMALLTNGEAGNQRRSIDMHGLERYFDCIVIEGEFGTGKPDERVFRHALQVISCDPARTWMVGDNIEADIAPAVALGLHAVWVDEAGDGVPARATAQPHRTVRTIAELL